MQTYKKIVHFIHQSYNTQEFIPLHEPRFLGNEKKYLNECIDSTFVSSVGKFVTQFEEEFALYVGSKYSVACVNGTSALHVALVASGVSQDDEVLTQALSFIATSNAINYCGAKPLFLDVDITTMGMSPKALQNFLENHCTVLDGVCINKLTKKTIKACVPMHTFGHPCEIDTIASLCQKWHISLIEDSAESLGSLYKGQHTGTFGKMGIFSFNGNKIITAGGGGVIVTDDETLARKLKHLTTTAKLPHKWEYIHDEIGFNYRMPNLNAALLVAQMQQLQKFLQNKRELAQEYKRFFLTCKGIKFLEEPSYAKSNYWLNAILFENKTTRDSFLEYTNSNGVMTRPVWGLLSDLTMFHSCYNDNLTNARYLQERVVNIPSGVRL
jgi:aminotransferase in exopolysaccharide biosynthesis